MADDGVSPPIPPPIPPPPPSNLATAIAAIAATAAAAAIAAAGFCLFHFPFFSSLLNSFPFHPSCLLS